MHCLSLVWDLAMVQNQSQLMKTTGSDFAMDTPLRKIVVWKERGGRKKGWRNREREREKGQVRLILNGYRRALCEAGRCCCSFISFQWERLSCVYLTLHCYFAPSWTREKGTGIIEPYIESRISLLFNPVSSSSFAPLFLSPRSRSLYCPQEWKGPSIPKSSLKRDTPDESRSRKSFNQFEVGKVRKKTTLKATKKLRKVMYSLSRIIAWSS